MRTNVKTSTPKIYTHEGATAVRIGSIEQLRRSVLANMLWEESFYEDGEAIGKRIVDTTIEVLREPGGADKVANLAYEARTKFKLRHVPLLLLTSLIHVHTDEARKVIAGAIAHVVQRPDELGELVNIFWMGYDEAPAKGKGKPGPAARAKRKMLPNQMKKGLALALAKFDEYALGKYDSDSAAVKLRDVLFLCHAKPKDEAQAELWKRLAAREMKTPDTWEVSLSAGKDKKDTFTRLLSEKKLGAMALLRNLRNMQEAGVDIEKIREGLTNMKTERILPFRFITAARYAPQLEPELEAGMFRCLEGFERLAGKTALVVDVSGSMWTPISGKSELQRIDAACALAMLLREICEDVRVIPFSDSAAVIPPRRGFALRDFINGVPFAKQGTDIARGLTVAACEGYDRCIVLTDEQTATPVQPPIRGRRGYFVNVAAYKNGVGYGPWTHIDGWSEAIVDYILQYERLDDEVAD